MLTPLSPYMNKKIAIYCTTKEEWDTIEKMTAKEGRRQPISLNAFEYWDTYGMQLNGTWDSLERYQKNGFEIINASEILIPIQSINPDYQIF